MKITITVTNVDAKTEVKKIKLYESDEITIRSLMKAGWLDSPHVGSILQQRGCRQVLTAGADADTDAGALDALGELMLLLLMMLLLLKMIIM